MHIHWEQFLTAELFIQPLLFISNLFTTLFPWMLVPVLPKSYKAFPILNKTDFSWAYLPHTAPELFYFLPRFLHRAASAHCPGRPYFLCIAAHCGHLSDAPIEFTSQQATNAMPLQRSSRYFESLSSVASLWNLISRTPV